MADGRQDDTADAEVTAQGVGAETPEAPGAVADGEEPEDQESEDQQPGDEAPSEPAPEGSPTPVEASSPDQTPDQADEPAVAEDAVVESEPGDSAAPATKSDVEPAADAEPDREAEPDAEPETESGIESDPEGEAGPEPAVDGDAEPEAQPEAVSELESPGDSEEEPDGETAPEPEAELVGSTESEGADGDAPDDWVPQPWDAPTAAMAPITADTVHSEVAPAPGLETTADAAAPVRIPTSFHRPDSVDASAGASAETAVEPHAAVETVAPAPAPAQTHALAAPALASAARQPSSPIDVFPEQQNRRRWPRVLGVSATVLVVLAGAYVGTLWFWSDRVPPGVTVAGVEIGGLQTAEAVARMDDTLAAATSEPIPVVTGDKRTEIDPVTAGLSLDVAATVASVTGFDLQPIRLWHHLFGMGVVAPVTDADAAALEAAVSEVAASLVTPPVDGSVVFVDGQPQGIEAVDGLAVDEEATRAALVDGWLTAPRPIELSTQTTTPTITQVEVERVLDELARPLVAAPVSVSVAGQIAELPPDVLATAASFVPAGDTLTLQLDGALLVEAVMARTTNLLTEPSDAAFVFQSGAPVIVPGVPGTTLDPEVLEVAVVEAATGADRTATVELVETDPSQSTAALEALGVTQIVSEFDTPLTREPRRTANIANGAAKINGVLVRPGEVFSLTDALGPIDAAHGFVEAGAIVNGEHSDAWGGGLSQISTTTYNAAFFGGFEDVEHTPHSEWFARYPEGREATIFTGVIDLKWRNDTPYGALIQSWVEAGRVHVRIWGTPHWTVEHSTSGRSGVTPPTTVYSQTPTCEPQAAGNSGFRVTVTRRVLLGGAEHSNESWNVRYRAQNTVVCGPPPAAGPPPAG